MSNTFENKTGDYDQSKIDCLASERASFNLEQVQLQFDLSNKLQRLLVENNKMYILTTTHVYRINLESPSEVLTVPYPVQIDSIKSSDAWLHPSGDFLIIQLNYTLCYHLHISYKKFKSLPRFKGLKIKHVAFFKSGKDSSTGDFLMATRDGQVLGANIRHHDPEFQDSKRDDKQVKQVFSSKKKIRGLTFSNNGTRVVVALENELLIWDCFEPSLNELSRSLHHPPLVEEFPGPGKFFTTGDNYYYFVTSASGLVVSNDPKIKSDSEYFSSLSGDKGPFSSLTTSTFFIFMLNSDSKHLLISNKLSPQSSQSLQLPTSAIDDGYIGMTSDNSGRTHWVFTRNKIFELIIANEDASAWYSYYKLGEYDQALEIIERGEGSEIQMLKKNALLIRQGYDYLQRGCFGINGALRDTPGDREISKLRELQRKGIEKLSFSNEPFEKVCLMLINVDGSDSHTDFSNELMLLYIQTKLDHKSGAERNQVKEVTLSSWVVRLFLSSIRTLTTSMFEWTTEDRPKKHMLDKCAKLRRDLFSFLRSKSKILDRATIYQMMNELGFTEELLEFANVLQDFEFIVLFHIKNESWAEALNALARAQTVSPEVFKQLIYRTSTILLTNSPKATTKCWSKCNDIEFEKLIPAILAYKGFDDQNNATLKFLSTLIFEKNLKSKAISECYLSLLIMSSAQGEAQSSNDNVLKALKFLSRGEKEEGEKYSSYDSAFMLRSCLRFGKIEPAIFILVHDLRLHKEALSTALKHNMIMEAEMVLKNYEDTVYQKSSNDVSDDLDSLSKEAVDPSRTKLEEDQNSTRRQLWFSYAKFLITGVCKDLKFCWNEASAFHTLKGMKIANESTELCKANEYPLPIGNDMVEAKCEKTELSLRLSEVVRYLLHLSFSVRDNASVLSIKDLLPLLPESIMISNFKTEIVDSLRIFNERINHLGLEMQDSSSIAEKLKTQINESRSLEKRGHVYTIIEPGEPCRICEKLLVRKKFIIFPNCHHGFHKDCMIRYLLQSKGDYTFKRSFRNFKQFSSIADKNELEELLLKECLLCNESKLNTIDDSVIDGGRSEGQEWVI